ncbi:MAG: DUF6580 family putative transport protein [Patescibacteria group bacterium]
MDTRTKIIAAIFLVALGIVCRLLPHVGNFAPIAAISLFAGFYLGRKYVLPVLALTMLIGDFFIGFYSWPLMAAVYGSYLIIGLLASQLKKYKSFETIFAASVFASVLFFAVTNLAVWQFSPWYAKNLAGLSHCFIAALPFFRATLLSDLVYTGALFGAYEAVLFLATRRQIAVKTIINQ